MRINTLNPNFVNFKQNNYQSQNEKAVQKTQLLDDVGMLCWLSGICLGGASSAEKLSTKQKCGRGLIILGAIVALSAMLKRAIMLNKN